MSDLVVCQQNLDSYIKQILSSIKETCSFDGEENALNSLSYYYRLKGIASFLEDADIKAFTSYLYLAAQTRLFFLTNVKPESLQDKKYNRTSANKAYFDALAVKDFDTASKLASLSQGRWDDNVEYEDDYLFYQFLHQLIMYGPQFQENSSDLIVRFEEIGSESTTFAVAKSLYDGDKDSFVSTLNNLIELRKENIERMRDLGDLPIIISSTELYIDIQGIAIARLVRYVNLEIDSSSLAVNQILLDLDELTIEYPDPKQIFRPFDF